MRAVLIKDDKGPIENLYIGEAETPKPSERGQILVKVKMFGVNRMDILQREGSYPVPAGASKILGVEFSGTVAELGPETSLFKVGDEVFGLAYGGAYAEYIVAYEAMLAPKPDHLTWAEAAGIAENWLTSYQALFMLGGLKKGERALLHVGASGIGVAANQMARFFEVEQVITTAGSPEKLSFLESMPYHPTDTINYKTEDFSQRVNELTEGKGVDFILDAIGKDYWHQNIDSLAIDGRLVMIGFMSGVDVPGFSLQPLLKKRLTIRGTTLRSRSPEYQSDLMQRFRKEVLPHMRGQHEDPSLNGLRVYVHKVFPWSEIQDAHREMETNKNAGKIVVEVI